MTRLVSFLELRLRGAELLGVLGSGLLENVLGRKVEGPYVRISMLEPEVVEIRVRCGTAKMTDDGLSYDEWDDFQRRGASTRLFCWGTSITRQIAAEKARIRDLLRENSELWLEYRDGDFSVVEEFCARDALAHELSELADHAFVEFHILPAQADEVLSLIATEEHG